MSAQSVPPGFHTVTPYFMVEDPNKFMEFLKKAFKATEKFLMRAPDGAVMHGQYNIGDSTIMFSEARGEHKANRMMMYLYLADCDAVYKAAIAAGGTSIKEPTNQFYGDRAGAVTDPCGNIWWMAMNAEQLTSEELERRQKEMFAKK